MIAVDGCASGCGSRQLAGRGIEAEAVSLDMLGVDLETELDDGQRHALAAEIAARLGRPHAAGALAPRRRQEPPASPPSAASAMVAHSVHDYLFAISLLTSPVGACGVVTSDVPTLAAHVARALGVSRPAAGEMLRRMEEAGQIERGPDKRIVLTRQGRAEADRIVAHHRIVERFLADVLGYTAGESHTLALAVRTSFPDDAVERLRRLVTPATTCPHGWPFEPGTGIELAPDLVALSALRAGERREVAALAEHDGELLTRLCDLGLAPGREVEVVERGADLTVAVEGSLLALGAHEAAGVLVRLSR